MRRCPVNMSIADPVGAPAFVRIQARTGTVGNAMLSFGQGLAADGHGTQTSRRPPAGVEAACLSELLAARTDGVMRPYRAPGHVVLLVSTGSGTHAVDFTHYNCRPGTVLWGRPGQVHHFGRQAGLDATVLAFLPAALPPLPGLDEYVNDPFAPAAWQPTGEDEDAIVADITQLATDCARYRRGDTLAAELLRHQIAVLMARILALDPSRVTRDASARALARLRAELEHGVGYHRVEEYATRLGCSVRTLTRACLAETGRSAKQLIDERIALEAKRLLATTDLPVADVGRELGFPEPTNFGRFFAREVGRTPGVFRASTIRGGPAPAVPAPRSALPGRLLPRLHPAPPA